MMLSVHSELPFIISRSSVFAEITAIGVFSSWLAFVIKRFWLSMFLTTGSTAREERKSMIMPKKSKTAAPTKVLSRALRASSLKSLFASRKQSKILSSPLRRE